MMQLFQLDQLRSSFSEKEFVMKTQKQLIKDFGRVGYDLEGEFEQELKLNALVSIIAQVIDEIERNNAEQLMQLLYLIDLPLELFTKNGSDSESRALSIIQREAYKVFLRSQF